MRTLVYLLTLLAASNAVADAPVTQLRFATAAPDGTSWAREFRAFARDVAMKTDGAVQIKWYFGGIAGDELQVVDRIRRGQLDGTASAAMLCQRLAPSARVMLMPGLFRNPQESAHIYSRLTQQLSEEFASSGFAYLGGPQLGADMYFTRDPVRTFAEVRRTKLWVWDLDAVTLSAMRAIGLNMVPSPVDQALAAYDAGRADGFLAIPAAALAFQWSTRARNLTAMPFAYLSGCLLIATRALDTLTIEQQQIVRAAGAKANARVTDAVVSMDDQLLHGLFAKQGVHTVPVSAQLESEFLAAARSARDVLGNEILPHGLLARVEAMLAEFRSRHVSNP
jgi:TRAP-type C4-dicarboxylate transport system substrate-binding protein